MCSRLFYRINRSDREAEHEKTNLPADDRLQRQDALRADDGAYRRRLAGAVMAYKAVYDARLDVEREPVDGLELFFYLAEDVGLKGIGDLEVADTE